MVALEKLNRIGLKLSTTVEILWWLQSPGFAFIVTDLQQQKSYGGFRVETQYFSLFIYNSRNLMVALEEKEIALGERSTTVEILWWLQSFSNSFFYFYLQQQKSYGGFRGCIKGFHGIIYNSRNLMVALEIITIKIYSIIYNSRNLMVALEPVVLIDHS